MNMWNKSLDPIQQAQIDFVVSQQHKTKKKRNTMNNQHRSLFGAGREKKYRTCLCISLDV